MEIARSLLDFFPPPKFLEMPGVGLDISDRRVRFLEFTKGNGGLVISRFGEMAIPAGVIVSGSIRDLGALQNVLREFQKKYSLSFAHVSLPEERAYLVRMSLPEVPEEELRDSILFQLEEYVPIPASEAVFDFTAIPGSQGEGKVGVIVSVLSRKEVETYSGAFEGTGITPLSFEIEAQAIARAVIPRGDINTYMVMDFGRSRTGVSVVSDEIVRYTSTIDIGSDMVALAVEKQFGVSSEEAYVMKNTLGLTKSKPDQEFFRAVASTVSSLREEVNKLYVYWGTHRQDGRESKKIQKIILCGGGANLIGLSDYLSTGLRTKVEVANPWTNVNTFENYIPEIPFNEALGNNAVIGLALKSIYGNG